MFALSLFAISGYSQGGTAAATPAATPAADTAPKAVRFTPTKDQIMQGQKILIEAKLYSGEATGVYGDSRTAIKEYQKANGLEVNGKFDRATLTKMGIELTAKQKGESPASAANGGTNTGGKTTTAVTTTTPATTSATSTATAADGPKRPAPFRSNKDQIMAAQKILRDGKMLTGGEDGKLDDLTREGLGKYQEANGLKVTKTLNALTLGKMGIALTDAQKAQVAAQAAYDAAKP